MVALYTLSIDVRKWNTNILERIDSIIPLCYYMPNFKMFLWVFYLFGNPGDRFSHDKAYSLTFFLL